ncbi:hypothetical protein A4X09_0g6519 [Tilletia walkeri]|uniref:Uncharacterized protein n=1 Tax=Tilletia walkeri TaxID=117179 RepID=A0A8X7N509_9BASI|nr:hypothetical protein A4X09_0g6519 [Tilletia walkeri]
MDCWTLRPRQAIQKEVEGYFKRNMGQTGVTTICMEAMQRRYEAEMQRDEAKRVLRQTQDELEDLKVAYDEVASQLDDWILEDGSPGPRSVAFVKELRSLRVEKTALKGLVTAQEVGLETVRGELKAAQEEHRVTVAEYSKRKRTDSGSFKVVRQSDEDQLRKDLAVERSLRIDLQRQLADLRMEHSLLQADLERPRPDPYRPPSHVDLNSLTSMREELDRLTHNEQVARAANDFYMMRHHFALSELEALDRDIGVHMLRYRSWMRGKEEEVRSMRRKLLSAKGLSDLDSPRIESSQTWTKHEHALFIDLPREALVNADDRRSSPPVLFSQAIRPDPESVRRQIDSVYLDLELEISAAQRSCVRYTSASDDLQVGFFPLPFPAASSSSSSDWASLGETQLL